MKRSKKKLFISIIIIGVLFQSNAAWGINIPNSFKNIKQTLDQRIYFREINEKVFARAHIPNAKAQFNPFIPKPSGPVTPPARGTRLFNNFPKPDFDLSAFKADMEKLRGWAESKIGKKTVSASIKIVKKITQKIKTAEKRRELKELLFAKVKEFAKNGREFVKAPPTREGTAPKLRLRAKKNLFDPGRERFRPKKEFRTGFTPSEKDVKGNNDAQKYLERSDRGKRDSLTRFTGLKR
ncbi:MAG: hypothetical protein U9Q24_00515 [Candidatus Ratteibacteria bacterium]|nr:hypothetical protein [Candidatus Ratteibacteria bacterium]